MKTLKTIQTLAKIGKVLSKIVFICCIVGLCGCGVGILALLLGAQALEINGMTLDSLLVKEADITLGTVYAAIFAGMILCVGELIVSKLACDYFTHELAQGTPFTFEGAKELLYLGIRIIWIPIAASVAAMIAQGIICAICEGVEPLELDNGDSVVLGVACIIVSVLCKYGAQLRQEQETAA